MMLCRLRFRGERWLQQESGAAEVLISCVESPSGGLEYLRTYGQSWKPHVVLMGVTIGNDITQDYVALNPHKYKMFDAFHGLGYFLEDLPPIGSGLRATLPRAGGLQAPL